MNRNLVIAVVSSLSLLGLGVAAMGLAVLGLAASFDAAADVDDLEPGVW